MNIDLEIVEKVVCGNGTSQEKAAVEEWLCSADEHRLLYKRIENYYFGESANKDISSMEIDGRWREFSIEEADKFTVKKRKLRVVLSSVSAVAAMVILTLLLWAPGSINNVPSVVVQAEKKPIIIYAEPIASDAVIVTTSSGDEYIVDQKDTLHQTSIKDVAVLNNNAISYENKETKVNVEYHTLTTPKGKDYKIVLADGTTVHLNANSRLIYPSSFGKNKERRVKLTGEAFFDVAHDKNSQFVVETSEIDVRVYGTKFNVNTAKRGVIETVLVEGTVSVMGETFAERQIKPDQMAQYNFETARLEVKEVEVMNYVSWCTGTYSFFEESLENIMLSLSSWYDKEIEFANERTAQMKFVCNLPRYSTIEEVMDVLVMSGNIQYKIIDNRVIISNGVNPYK